MRFFESEIINPRVAQLLNFLLVIGILTSLLIAGAKTGSAQTGFNVGYDVVDFKYNQNGEEHVLTVAVWYPATAEPTSFNYGGPTTGTVAVASAPGIEDGPFPLLVFSHGYGGSGLGAVFFTQALAARGWIVACPDHHDSHSAVRIRTGQQKFYSRLGLLRDARKIGASGPGDRDKYLYRLDEIRAVLEGMMASERFGKLIDRDRIAAGGHSFGGFTALGLCGTIKERHDPRIKAVLLFSTGAGGYLYTEDELKEVRIPSMLFLGEREEHQKRGSITMAELSATIYGSMTPPKYFLEIKGASHFSFNNRFTNNRISKSLSGTEEQFEVIRRYSIAFLEKHFAGKESAGRELEQTDPLLARYDSELAPNASQKAQEAQDTRIRRTEADAPADTLKPPR